MYAIACFHLINIPCHTNPKYNLLNPMFHEGKSCKSHPSNRVSLTNKLFYATIHIPSNRPMRDSQFPANYPIYHSPSRVGTGNFMHTAFPAYIWILCPKAWHFRKCRFFLEWKMSTASFALGTWLLRIRAIVRLGGQNRKLSLRMLRCHNNVKVVKFPRQVRS